MRSTLEDNLAYNLRIMSGFQMEVASITAPAAGSSIGVDSPPALRITPATGGSTISMPSSVGSPGLTFVITNTSTTTGDVITLVASQSPTVALSPAITVPINTTVTVRGTGKTTPADGSQGWVVG